MQNNYFIINDYDYSNLHQELLTVNLYSKSSYCNNRAEIKIMERPTVLGISRSKRFHRLTPLSPLALELNLTVFNRARSFFSTLSKHTRSLTLLLETES